MLVYALIYYEDKLLNADLNFFHWLEVFSLCLVIAAWWTGTVSHPGSEGILFSISVSDAITLHNRQNCRHTKCLFFLLPSAWHSESFEEHIDDNFDIVFPERIDKGRTKRDLSTGTKVFSPDVRI